MAVGTTTALVISLAATAATAAASYSSQKQAAKRQRAAQEAHNTAIQKEAIRQYGELDDDEADIIYDSHKESLQAQKEIMVARSTIELQSAASGTGGQSVDAVIENLNLGFGQRTAEIINERDRALDQVNTTARNIAAQAELGQDLTPIAEPSAFSAAIKGAKTGMSIYSTLSSGGSTLKDAGAAPSRSTGAAFGTRSSVGTTGMFGRR